MTTTPPPPRPRIESFRELEVGPLIERFSQGAQRFERRLLDLNDAQADTFFRPEAEVGRWSCRVLVGHVADADLVYVHRMRRTVAEERPVLAAWDENAFIDAGLYGGEAGGAALPLAGFIAIIHTSRLWCADWLRTLDRKEFEAKALHCERVEMSVLDMLTQASWHLEHHAWYLSRKLERLLGPA